MILRRVQARLAPRGEGISDMWLKMIQDGDLS